MAILGTYSYFAPDIAEVLDEAFERCGIAPAAVGNDHIDSAMRSLRLQLNSEWATYGMTQWAILQATQVLTAGDADFDLPTGGIDVMSAVLRRNSADTPMVRMSRTEFLELPNKSDEGRPDRFLVERFYDKATVTLWRVPENSTDEIVYYYFRQLSKPGDTLQYTLQLPPSVLEAFVAGMAARLAQKHAPDRWPALLGYYRGPDPNKIGGVLKYALDENRERADLRLSVVTPRPRRFT